MRFEFSKNDIVRSCLGFLLAALTFTLLLVELAFARDNFVVVKLPKRVSVELPQNWIVLSKNERTTLEASVQARAELLNTFDASTDLTFAANSYDEHNLTQAMINVRYYPEQAVTQEDLATLSDDEFNDLDVELHKNLKAGVESTGGKLTEWFGTKKQNRRGITALISAYRRPSGRTPSTFYVRTFLVLNGPDSFTVTVSFREDRKVLLEPICERIIRSIRVGKVS